MEIIGCFEVWTQWIKKKIHDRTTFLHGKKRTLRKDWINCKNKIDWTGIVAWKPLPELYKEG